MTNRKPSRDDVVTTGQAYCESAEQTRELGAEFARIARGGFVLSLEGPLGAGKTEFAKGFLAALGFHGEVSSPTFTLLHEYAGGRMPVVHFDWYRLEEADEVIGLGWDDYVESGDVLLVEWGNRFSQLLPTGTVRLQFEIEGALRDIRWEQVR